MFSAFLSHLAGFVVGCAALVSAVAPVGAPRTLVAGRSSPATSVAHQSLGTASLHPSSTLALPGGRSAGRIESAFRGPAPAKRPARTAFGVGLRIPNSNILAFWNQYARTVDAASSGDYNVGVIPQATAGLKALTLGQVGNADSIVQAAAQNGIRYVIFDLEGTSDCATLTSEEATVYQKTQAAGLKLVFSPTGSALSSCYRTNPAIVANTDVLLYQTEHIQGQDPNYTQTVQTLVRSAKRMRPGLPVWVQVSVNPPANRSVDAATVLSTIHGLEDGTAGAPDLVYVFYLTDGQYAAGRVQVMEQVVSALRS